MVCTIRGAKTVVVTDYPDPDLVGNLHVNASACDALLQNPSPLRVEGYRWGAPPDDVLKHISCSSLGFDVLILADVIYNHPQHRNLISSIKMMLKRSPEAIAFVVFTPYQPWLLEKIVAFFPLAESSGFTVTKLFENTMDKVMFEEDPGVS